MLTDSRADVKSLNLRCVNLSVRKLDTQLTRFPRMPRFLRLWQALVVFGLVWFHSFSTVLFIRCHYLTGHFINPESFNTSIKFFIEVIYQYMVFNWAVIKSDWALR
jgi:hypothetical protein